MTPLPPSNLGLHGHPPSTLAGQGSLSGQDNSSATPDSFRPLQLCAQIREQLHHGLRSSSLVELISLSRETDPELFAESLYAWGRRRENSDELDAAGLAYSILSQRDPQHPGQFIVPGFPDLVRRQAEARLEVLSGNGSTGDHLEFLSRRFARQAMAPAPLIGMGVAGLAFRGMNLFAATRLANLSAGLLTRGPGLRILSGLAGFTTEVPAFTFGTKFASSLLGEEQDYSARAIRTELASGALVLGSLKLFGMAFGHVGAGLALPKARLGGLGVQQTAPLQIALQQAGMLTGIMAGHSLEVAFGLRERQNASLFLVESLVTLAQFNVAGRLSHSIFGERYERLQQSLAMQSAAVGAGSTRPSWQGNRGTILPTAVAEGRWTLPLRGFAERFRQWQGRGGLQEALAEGMEGAELNGGRIRVIRPSGGIEEARKLNSLMTGEGEGGSRPRERVWDTGIREDVDPIFPRRKQNFERPMAPNQILRVVPKNIGEEILNRIENVRNHLANLAEYDLGLGLGLVLQERMKEVFQHRKALPEEARAAIQAQHLNQMTYEAIPALESLDPVFQNSLSVVSEIIGVIEYARRSNQQDILKGVRQVVTPETSVDYPELKHLVSILLGPRLRAPQGPRATGEEVIQPDRGFLSIGGGDMASFARLIAHRIRPGELPWYYRLWVITPKASTAREIGERGTYREKMGDRVYNHDGDPLMIAVPETPLDRVKEYNQPGAILPADLLLKQLVRVQFLNVPSWALPDVTIPEIIRHLPEGCIFASAIGGLIRGVPKDPKDPNTRSMYPNAFVRERLSIDPQIAEDVEVVTIPGFIPGKYLWEGKRVRMGVAVREIEEGSGIPREAARVVGELIAGKNLENNYVSITLSHWVRSSDVGKVNKNIFSLHIGRNAGHLARQVADGEISQDKAELEHRQEVDRGWEHMKAILRENEIGINPDRIDFRLEVKEDYDDCTKIQFGNVVRLFQIAKEAAENPAHPIREWTVQEVREFFKANVLDRRYDLATTRNPVRGVAQALYEYFVNRGMRYSYGDVIPKLTEEGVNSLQPVASYYAHPDHPIENRHLPEPVYKNLQAFFSGHVHPIPLRIQEHLREALRGQVQFEMQGRRLRIDPQRLREALEGSMQRSVDRLEKQLYILDLLRRRHSHLRDPARAAQQQARVIQQWEVVDRFIEAMRETNPMEVSFSPHLEGAYQSLFMIQGIRPDMDRAFIRVDGHEIMRRLTQLGLFLKRAPWDRRLHIETEMTGVDPLEDAKLLAEAAMTARDIMTSFHQSGRRDVTLEIGGQRIYALDQERQPLDEGKYYGRLRPLVQNILALPPESEITDEMVHEVLRQPRHDFGKLLDDFIQSSPGWPMLLGEFYGGPINQMVKSALTRPEKVVPLGIFHEGQLVDAVSLYRSANNEPIILGHHMVKRFEPHLTPLPGVPISLKYFRGLVLEDFLTLYRRYAQEQGWEDYQLRALTIRSLPLEEALVFRIPGINPALLRRFLMEPSEERKRLIREVNHLYHSSSAVNQEILPELLKEYLRPFQEAHPEKLQGDPLYQLIENNPGALLDFVRRRPEIIEGEE